ncbi:MAG: ABC transporter ATP-binding protein [Clostridia bacterium]|nr:ABC transporter ATP-binding protein [Clostridia bacterium]
MIELKDLTFSYTSKPFIKDVYARFEDGAITAIIGENGSGKSTLLKLISGELKAKYGSVIVDGKDLNALKRKDVAKLLSHFPQGREIPDMTALELVSLGRYPYLSLSPVTPKEEENIALSALRYVGAERFAFVDLKKMSYGERQRVYLAMQIAQGSQNMLLDEPTSFLDIGAQFEVMNILTSLRNEGKCIVCILHDIPLAMRCADSIMLMKNGNIIAQGTPTELYESRKLEETFGISLEKVEFGSSASFTVMPRKT